MRTLSAGPAGASRDRTFVVPSPVDHTVTRVCHEIVTVACKFSHARRRPYYSNA